jgi:glutaminyl-peptide cyclotransferase
VAVLLEVARSLGRAPRPGHAVELVFFDGEEAFGPSITGRDGLYGANALAAKLAGEGALGSIEALVLVDMIGDRELNLGLDSNSDAGLLRMAREIAAEQGDADLFDPSSTFALVDDHLPFRQRGVERVLALIDFQFGAKYSPGPLWHTERDNLQAVSAESLNRIGRLVVQLVGRIERDAAGRADAAVP